MGEARALIEPYKQTALRNIAMADALLDARFHDGAAFHIYHAYESILCSALLKRQPNNLPPMAHQAKLNRFQNLFASERTVAQESAKLSNRKPKASVNKVNSLHSIRNRVLYPEFRELSTVIMPASAVSEKQARSYLSKVKQFVNLLISYLTL